MSILQWFIPCYFNKDKGRDDEVIYLDISDSIKAIFENDLVKKKVEFGNNYGLRNFTPEQIKKVEIKILPRFLSGYVNEKRLIEFVETNSNKIYNYFNVDSFKKWHYAYGAVCIRIELKYKLDIVTRNDIKERRFPNDSITQYHQNKALLKEVSSLFLAALHLTFPTESIMNWNESPVNDGIMHIQNGKKNYFTALKTDNFMHHVLINMDRLTSLEKNIKALSKVWHLNLWSLKRYLIAVNSNLIGMDNLLDLVYSLEGLFDKNTSSDFIKLFCCLYLTENKNDARFLKSKLDLIFKIRNDIAHGGYYYTGHEKLKLNGKEIMSEELYWSMKFIVSQMIILAISKLLNNKEMKNLTLNTDDFFDKIYSK